ncbi:MAG: tyrosine--tRNA ligase [Deltaproteobacteria bacterium]|jgi:tyrosyl-tRNA synthetase|nr:tyrosine--tRNA ligase [Deltaproteobacteria bacterium]
MKLYDELEARGFVDKVTSEELIEKLNAGGLKFYIGYDPTADSLHIGHLASFNLMKIFQNHGHHPIALMGGGTGMIGDPGGKNAERNLLSKEQIQSNINGVKKQMSQFLNFETENKAIMVNNLDWLRKWSYIDFLRDIGKNFSVNMMMTRDSVKSRLTREGEGISYTEFSYMILQSYDFYELSKLHDCQLQLGGSDQWGNIVSGIDLTRRLSGKQVYGMTFPLITKSDGTKFGKSEGGAIWLDAEKTSPYEFYQYFVRQADEDIIRYLKVFTQLTMEEIAELEAQVKNEPYKRAAQKKLAEEVTRTVHGQDTLDKVLKASQVLFGAAIEDLDDSTIANIFKDVPSTLQDKKVLESGWNLIDALVETKACKSKGQARKLVQSGGVYVNNNQQKDTELQLTHESMASESYLILRTGKKNYYLVQFK